MLVLLLAGIATPLDAAERSQGILQRDLATAVIAFLGLACVALSIWLRGVIADVKALTRETVSAIERNTASNVTLTQAVSELYRRRRRNTGEVPVLGHEPITGASQPGIVPGVPLEER